MHDPETFRSEYLRAHRHPVNRALHAAGWVTLIFSLAGAAWTGGWMLVPIGVCCAYALAWIGHFAFEKNVPETFRRPVSAGIASFHLFVSMLRGKSSGRG